MPDGIVNTIEKDLHFHMMEWLKEKGKITPTANHNWKVVPEAWAKIVKPKDSLLLFGEN